MIASLHATVGLRRLVQRPWGSLAIVVSLALGIGFATTVTSFLQALVWTSLTSFEEPERVVAVYQQPLPGQASAGPVNPQISLPVYKRLSESRAFSAVTARQFLHLHLERSGSGGSSRKALGEMVSASYFQTARAEIALGRAFLAEEDEVPGRDAVVVLADHAWRERFGQDPGILGQHVLLGDHPFQVVGVAEPGFVGANRLSPSDFWVPLAAHPWVFPYPEMIGPADGRVLRPLARLAPDVDIASARRQLEELTVQLAEEFPAAQGDQVLALQPLAGGERSPFQQAVAQRGRLALGMAGVLLLLACANAANLLLVRSRARRRETAIQAALGAGTWVVVRQHLYDALLLAIAGGILGWGLAVVLRRLLWAFRPPYLPASMLDAPFPGGLIAIACGLALAAGVATALAPMWSSRRPDLTVVLQQEAQRASGPGRRALVPGSLLLAFEAALGTLALAVATLFLADVRQARDIDPGFERERLVIASFDFHGTRHDHPAIDRLRERLIERLSALPGAVSVAAGENWPLGGFRMFRAVAPAAAASEGAGVSAGSSLVDAGYFQTAGVPLLSGRGFVAADLRAPRSVVVNQTLAARLWPGESALGREVAVEGVEGPCAVAGVAADSAVMELGEAPQPFIYLPLTAESAARFTLHVRTATDAESLLPAVQRAIDGVAPRLPLEELTTVSRVLDRSLWIPRLIAAVLAIVSLCALALAAVGIYGVAAVHAARSEREAGVRLALGEDRKRLVGRLATRSFRAVVAGVAAGLVVSQWAARVLGSVLYEAGAMNWHQMVAVALVCVAVAVPATLFPVLRTVRRDPVEALRAS